MTVFSGSYSELSDSSDDTPLLLLLFLLISFLPHPGSSFSDKPECDQDPPADNESQMRNI